MDDILRLSDLVAARLCHDIAGVMATLSGMLELAGDPRAPPEAIAAASEAATELTHRLDLLREAWTGEAAGLNLTGLQALARGLPGAHRLRLDLSALPQASVFPPRMARLVLNAILMAAESLPRGGMIGLAAAGRQDLLITIAGPRGGWPPRLAACLVNEQAALEALQGPRTLMAPLVALLARHLGIRVSILLPTGRVRRAMPPLLLSPESLV
ncbi:MAG TPA: histidine phosphotransferase family protein [Acetobacteraceae bacterium]|nr:histidine phosphotransferase family protein [Acetobacteraceae bacterium]